jgi:sulfoxide reductase heme-binding subunit YedZ
MSYLQQIKLLKRFIFFTCCIPLAWLVWQATQDKLGANPIEAVIHTTGLWALRFLLLSLTATPLRLLFKWNWPMQLRRMLGLFAFFYACLHLTAYIYLDQYFAWADIFEDILKRPYITLGMAAWILLTPLAITSTHKMVQRLGGKRWSLLHKLVYPIATIALLHYALLIKAGWSLAAPYIVIFIILMAVRLRYLRHNKIC